MKYHVRGIFGSRIDQEGTVIGIFQEPVPLIPVEHLRLHAWLGLRVLDEDGQVGWQLHEDGLGAHLREQVVDERGVDGRATTHAHKDDFGLGRWVVEPLERHTSWHVPQRVYICFYYF